MNYVDTLHGFLVENEIPYEVSMHNTDFFFRGHLILFESDGRKLIDMFGRNVIDFLYNMDA